MVGGGGGRQGMGWGFDIFQKFAAKFHATGKSFQSDATKFPQKPFRRKPTFCKFKYTILSKGYKESQVFKLYTVTVSNEPYTDQLYLQESTWFLFTSVYFDITVSYGVQLIKNTLKQTKFEDKTVKSTQLLLFPVGLHDFQIFPDRTAHA